MYCIICERKIIADKEFNPFKDDHNTTFFKEGVVGKLEANYGSSHDGDIFMIALCDNCISEKLKSNTLLYKGNYMLGDDIVKDNIDKSIKGYTRRINIDKLIN